MLTIQERLGGSRIQVAFAIDHSVILVSVLGVQCEVGLADPCRSQVVERRVHFEEGILAEDGVIEFGSSFNDVERATVDLAFGLTGGGLVPVILWSTRAVVVMATRSSFCCYQLHWICATRVIVGGVFSCQKVNMELDNTASRSSCVQTVCHSLFPVSLAS